MTYKRHNIGRAGEYLVAAMLSQIADTVIIVPHASSSDIILEYQDKLYRCQVKTKSKFEKQRLNWRFDLRRSSRKDRKYYENEIEIFGLANLMYRNVIFIKNEDEKNISQITITDEHMKNNDPVKNFLNLIEAE